jgi:hypothetical protein
MDRSFNLPEIRVPYPPPPKKVQVTNPPKPEFGKDFFWMVRRQYQGLKAELKENEALVMLYDSPAGERIHVENVVLSSDSDTLIFQGRDSDGHLCQVITQAQSVQLVMKIIPSQKPDRKPIGFGVIDQSDQERP